MTDEAAGAAGNVLPSSSAEPRPPVAFLIVFIQLPFKGLRPNDRMNRWDRASQYKAYQQSCYIDARNAMLETFATEHGPGYLMRELRPPVRAQAVYNFHKNRGRDGDNLAAALKGAWDGFVRAGLLTGDTLRDLWIDPIQVTMDKTRPEGVTITFTEEHREP